METGAELALSEQLANIVNFRALRQDAGFLHIQDCLTRVTPLSVPGEKEG